ncbi:hypothetical protein BV898_02143 [Hypsibius exemplaris]|uniref:G-protein coupled receptors family 1 profile domain-containing protein n=1 Tax=Hypsibius exemplaris TaxID=2072580 RepID=A0A1W0X9J3_HYPEX|nr:hypothetical protein BV898_02143 [Hypsibius exemplaris]
MNTSQGIRNTSNNSTQAVNDQSLLFSLIIWTVIGLTVNAVGAIGHAVLLWATFAYRPLRAAANWPLMAHNIGLDLIMTVISNSGAVIVTFKAYLQPLTPLFCHVWGPIRFLTICVCTWTHCVLAVNRFLGMVSPACYKHFVTRKALLTGIVFPWFIGATYVFFPAAGLFSRYKSDGLWSIGCFFFTDSPAHKAYGSVMNLYLPLTISGICYCLVAIHARVALRVRLGQAGPLVDRNARNRYETSKVLLLCFLWYFTPNLATIGFNNSDQTAEKRVLIIKGLMLAVSTVAVNPLFFLAVSSMYRQGSIYVIKLCLRRLQAWSSQIRCPVGACNILRIAAQIWPLTTSSETTQVTDNRDGSVLVLRRTGRATEREAIGGPNVPPTSALTIKY